MKQAEIIRAERGLKWVRSRDARKSAPSFVVVPAVFVYPEERFDSLTEEFDELLDAHQSGGLAD